MVLRRGGRWRLTNASHVAGHVSDRLHQEKTINLTLNYEGEAEDKVSTIRRSLFK